MFIQPVLSKTQILQALNSMPLNIPAAKAAASAGTAVPKSMPIFESFNMMADTTQMIKGTDFISVNSPKETLRQESQRKTEPSGYAPPAKQTVKNNIPGAPKTAVQQMQQMLQQAQSMVTNLVASPESMRDMAQVLGPNAAFEDVLAYVMMKIAKEEENKVAERIQILENGGHPGIKGWFAHRAADLAGVAGGAIGAAAGAWAGGAGGAAAGAAAGRDVGKQLTNSFTGYNSEDSRQIQFEKLKHQMNKLSEFMTCISNILANMHSTTKNTISNMRA